MGTLRVGTLPNRPQRPTSSRPLLVPPASAALRALTDASFCPRSGVFCLEEKRGGFSWAPRFQGGLLPQDSALALPSSLPAAQRARPGPGQPVGQRAPTRCVQGGPWAGPGGTWERAQAWALAMPSALCWAQSSCSMVLETDDGEASPRYCLRAVSSAPSCAASKGRSRAPRLQTEPRRGERCWVPDTVRVFCPLIAFLCVFLLVASKQVNILLSLSLLSLEPCAHIGPSACCLGCTSGCQLPP